MSWLVYDVSSAQIMLFPGWPWRCRHMNWGRIQSKRAGKMRKKLGWDFTGEENLGFVLESECCWESEEKKVVLDERDRTSKGSGRGRKNLALAMWQVPSVTYCYVLHSTPSQTRVEVLARQRLRMWPNWRQGLGELIRFNETFRAGSKPGPGSAFCSVSADCQCSSSTSSPVWISAGRTTLLRSASQRWASMWQADHWAPLRQQSSWELTFTVPLCCAETLIKIRVSAQT